MSCVLLLERDEKMGNFQAKIILTYLTQTSQNVLYHVREADYIVCFKDLLSITPFSLMGDYFVIHPSIFRDFRGLGAQGG